MADPFSVFTAGRVGERAIEESRFRRGIDVQQQQLGLQSRGLDIQEQGQAQQVDLQQQQETRLQGAQDMTTEAGRIEAGIKRVRMLASLEASRLLLVDNGQDGGQIGKFIESQGGLKESLKLSGLNKDQFELMVLREKEQQNIAQRESSQTTLGATERIVEQQPGGGVETIVPPVEAAAKPPSRSAVIGDILSTIRGLPGGAADLTPQDQQVLAFELSQNPLSQFALAGGQSVSELLGGSFFEDGNLSAAEQNIVRNSLEAIEAGTLNAESVLAQLEANETLSDERRRAIAIAIGINQ